MQFNYDAYKAGFQAPTKKTQEQELMEKMRLLNYQSQLQNSQLGDLEKRYRLMMSDPEGFQRLMELNNMMTPYQQGMLNVQRGQLGIQREKYRSGLKPEPVKKILSFE